MCGGQAQRWIRVNAGPKGGNRRLKDLFICFFCLHYCPLPPLSPLLLLRGALLLSFQLDMPAHCGYPGLPAPR